MNSLKQPIIKSTSTTTTSKHSSSMKLLPKIESYSKAKNVNDQLLIRQNHTPIKVALKKSSFTNIDYNEDIPQSSSINNASQNEYKNFFNRRTQKILDTSEEQKIQKKQMLAKSQIQFKPPSSSNQIVRNVSGINENPQQANYLQNTQSASSVKSSYTKIPLQASQILEEAKPVKFTSPITQLQIDADQNRLDFMLEKGMNFEKNNQLIKQKQDNFELKQEIRKLEAEIKRMRQEIEAMRQLNQKSQSSNNERKSSFFMQDDQISQIEKKVQLNEYYRQQISNLKAQHESDSTKYQEQINKLNIQLQQALEQIQNLQISKQNPIKEQKDLEQIQEAQTQVQQMCNQCEQNLRQIQDFNIQINVLESNLATSKAQNENLFKESQWLREWQIKTKESQIREKEQYEKYIQEQSEEILKVDSQLREFKKQYDELNEKIKLVKNGSDIFKVFLRNEYALLKLEIVENIERLNKERSDRINENVIQIQQLQQKYDDEKKKATKLQDEVDQLNQHLEWLKKRGIQQSKQNGTFNYIGLSEEILSLKKVIDQHIQEIPNKDIVQSFQSKVDEMSFINKQMVDKINKIQQDEEKSKKATEQIPVLKQFDIAQTKVEYHLVCAKCEDILEEAITCVPCGHNYCKKCHYTKDSSFQKANEATDVSEASISCMKCGPSTMIYRNESLDDMIKMYNIMKSAKEVIKMYLSQ
ncbi:hypothetical protein ABPG72_014313 [Tetrahymena utriculariae]